MNESQNHYAKGKKQSAVGEAERAIIGQGYKRHKETSGGNVALFSFYLWQ